MREAIDIIEKLVATAIARVLLERVPIGIATTSVSIQSQVLPEEVSEAGVESPGLACELCWQL